MARLAPVVRALFNGQAGASGFQIERLRASFLPRRRGRALLLGGEGRCPSRSPGYLEKRKTLGGVSASGVGDQVVVRQIGPGPDLDQDQGDSTGVFQRVGLAKGHKKRLTFAE